MKTKTADILSLLALAAAVLVAIVMYPSLPDQIPTHWNVAGEVDDYTAKPWGVVILPLAAGCSWLLFKIIPLISPKGFRTDEFQGVVNVFQVAMVVLLSLIAVLVLLAAADIVDLVAGFVPIGVGLLFIIIGNYLGKVRKNFFIGIRTPWTLASDEVWARTHWLGARVFMVCGALLIAVGFLEEVPTVTMVVVGVILIVALVPVVYSYLLYRRLEGFEDRQEGERDAGKPR